MTYTLNYFLLMTISIIGIDPFLLSVRTMSIVKTVFIFNFNRSLLSEFRPSFAYVLTSAPGAINIKFSNNYFLKCFIKAAYAYLHQF